MLVYSAGNSVFFCDGLTLTEKRFESDVLLKQTKEEKQTRKPIHISEKSR